MRDISRDGQGDRGPEHGVENVNNGTAEIHLVVEVEHFVDHFKTQHDEPWDRTGGPSPQGEDGEDINAEPDMDVQRIPAQMEQIGEQDFQVVQLGYLPALARSQRIAGS